MREHFADTVRMREAMVTGEFAEFKAAAAAVASDPWSPNLRDDYEPYVDAVRASARSAQSTESPTVGAASLAKLGEACASCHLKFGGPGSPVAPTPLATAPDGAMAAHAAAAERLWAGLMSPSDAIWMAGATALIEAPELNSDVTEVAAAARHLRELAKAGQSAAAAQRGRIFADVLLTCGACHERLGINVRAAGNPR